jgi:PAS domain S-box-containing protein
MTLVNQRGREMVGYTDAELLQMIIADVTDPDNLAPTLEAVRRLAEGGPDFDIEKCYRRKDGSILWAVAV